jgi:hypothetical protein
LILVSTSQKNITRSTSDKKIIEVVEVDVEEVRTVEVSVTIEVDVVAETIMNLKNLQLKIRKNLVLKLQTRISVNHF